MLFWFMMRIFFNKKFNDLNSFRDSKNNKWFFRLIVEIYLDFIFFVLFLIWLYWFFVFMFLLFFEGSNSC